MLVKNQPLWMPTGSVRSILALLIVVPVTAVAVTSNIVLTGDQLVGLASLILTAYFLKAGGTRA